MTAYWKQYNDEPQWVNTEAFLCPAVDSPSAERSGLASGFSAGIQFFFMLILIFSLVQKIANLEMQKIA